MHTETRSTENIRGLSWPIGKYSKCLEPRRIEMPREGDKLAPTVHIDIYSKIEHRAGHTRRQYIWPGVCGPTNIVYFTSIERKRHRYLIHSGRCSITSSWIIQRSQFFVLTQFFYFVSCCALFLSFCVSSPRGARTACHNSALIFLLCIFCTGHNRDRLICAFFRKHYLKKWPIMRRVPMCRSRGKGRKSYSGILLVFAPLRKTTQILKEKIGSPTR